MVVAVCDTRGARKTMAATALLAVALCGQKQTGLKWDDVLALVAADPLIGTAAFGSSDGSALRPFRSHECPCAGIDEGALSQRATASVEIDRWTLVAARSRKTPRCGRCTAEF